MGAPGPRGTRRGGTASAPALTAAGWAAGLGVTLLIVGTPYLVFAYHRPALHLVLGTVDGCVALLVAYLVYGRFLRSRRWQDLLLAQGLFLLGVAELGLVLFLRLFDTTTPGTLDVWLPLALRTVAALLIALAALVGGRRVGFAGHPWGGALPWGLVSAAFAAAWTFRHHLPVALAQSPPASAEHPIVTGHPVLLAAQGFASVCFMVASVAFTIRARRLGDALLRWLGPACALAAFARVNYVLFPSLYSDWVYTGDILRTGSYLLLLMAATREIRQYWADQARVAVLEDRRRLARELHDGVLQEISYIRDETRAMAPGQAASGRILAACDRALDEARAAVDALGRAGVEPLASVLHRAALQVAERYGARLDVEVDDAVTADAEQLHALVRITREAVSNAIRHGGARVVRLRLLREDGGRRLVVEDDGSGFDVEAASNGSGYGITSMRERAVALPGTFEITSAAGRGATVTVTW